MTSPDDTYRRAVLALQSLLGRPPTTKDPEYVRLGEECRLAWVEEGHARETVLPPTRDDAEHEHLYGWDDKWSPVPAHDAREVGQEALTKPGAAQKAGVAPTSQTDVREAGEAAERPMAASPSLAVGARGPGGGVMAVCQACRRMWERPVARGRPSRKCEECRS